MEPHATNPLRRLVRRVVPAGWRSRARRALSELPHRLRDAPADLRELVRPGEPPVPGPGLRRRVGRNGSRSEFLAIGRDCARDLLAAFGAAREPGRAYPRWLDFGGGCGRVSRHLLGRAEPAELDGVDVDARQIAWARRHLPGRWFVGPGEPPLPLPAASYDVVFAVSVFTHLSEPLQDAWLDELGRVLAPGGLLVASTHGPRLANDAFPLDAGQLRELERAGFLFVTAPGPFNQQAAFHSESYLRSRWSRGFECRGFRPAGLRGYQDLSVWRAAPGR